MNSGLRFYCHPYSSYNQVYYNGKLFFAHGNFVEEINKSLYEKVHNVYLKEEIKKWEYSLKLDLLIQTLGFENGTLEFFRHNLKLDLLFNKHQSVSEALKEYYIKLKFK